MSVPPETHLMSAGTAAFAFGPKSPSAPSAIDCTSISDWFKAAQSAAKQISEPVYERPICLNDATALTRMVLSFDSICRARNAHGQRVRHGATIESVYGEYLEHFVKRGVGHYHLRDVKRYVGNFVAAFPGLISAIQTTAIDAYLSRLGGSARNKNNHRHGIIAFCNFSQEKGFLPHGIIHAASATTDYRDARTQISFEQQAIDLLQPTDIYSPEEMRKILVAADDSLRATLEIKAFSGVRTEEIVRLWWVMVAEAESCLKVPDAVGKISARRVPLLPNLQTRLAKYSAELKRERISADLPSANSLTRAWARIAANAGVPYKRNAFRNSYITYRLILTDDISKVAEECGTSAKMIRKNYQSRAHISRATAEEWFAL